jgi:hypothetical protein
VTKKLSFKQSDADWTDMLTTWRPVFHFDVKANNWHRNKSRMIAETFFKQNRRIYEQEKGEAVF